MLNSPASEKSPIQSPGWSGKPGFAATESTLWTAFWQEFCLENVPHERCHVPDDGRCAVDRQLAQFADGLPVGAQVIDLGCGAGIAGRILLSRRGDLRVTGVDFASVPASAVENMTVCPGVRMDDVPFDDGSFDAAISLFGIEYGDIEQTAAEMWRVLKPGARFRFLVHHAESEIVREGTFRRRALLDLLSGEVRGQFLAGNVAGVAQHVRRLRNKFPGEPSIRLFTDYLRHHVARPSAGRQERWQNLIDGLGPEIALLALMERSAKSAGGIGSWLAPLLRTMSSASASVLRRPSGEPIAWQVSGVR